MRPRLVACVLAVAACVLGASLAAALSPSPSPPGLSPSRDGGGEVRASSNDTGNDTRDPPTNETPRDPRNGTGNRTPLPAPTLTPEHQRIRGAAGSPVRFEVVVTNPAHDTQRVSVALRLPTTWRGHVDPFNGTLGPGASVTVTGSVSSPALVPTRALVGIDAIGRDNLSRGTLDVCFVTAVLDGCAGYGPNGTRPPSNDTRPPRNDTGGNGTKPPRNETGDPGNETGEPGNDTAPSSATFAAAAPASPLAARDVEVDLAASAPRPGPAARVAASAPGARASGEGTLRLI